MNSFHRILVQGRGEPSIRNYYLLLIFLFLDRALASWYQGVKSRLDRDQPAAVTCQPDALQCTGHFIQCFPPCLNKSEEALLNLQACAGLKNLYIKSSCLTTVPPTLTSWSQLEVLDLSYNAISSLGIHALRAITELKVINMEHNRLLEINGDPFEGLGNLEEIYLNNNLLVLVGMKTFRANLPNLKVISLANNLLLSVDMWPLVLPSAQVGGETPFVDLSANHIAYVSNDLGVTIEDIRERDSVYVYLVGNKLSHVSQFNLIDRLNVQIWSDFLRMKNMIIDIRENPLHCDCGMYEFLNFTKDLQAFFNHRDLSDYFQLICASPEKNAGWQVTALADFNFQCEVAELCPRGCTCIRTPSNETVIITCYHWKDQCMPEQLPNSPTIHLYMPGNKVISLSDRSYLSNVTIMDLSNNELQVIDLVAWKRLNRLEILLLSNNRLMSFPKDFGGQMFEHLKLLEIHGNSLHCDCQSLWLRDWVVNHSHIVTFSSELACTGREKLTKLTRSDMCSKQNVGTSDRVRTILLMVLILIVFCLLVRYAFRHIRDFSKHLQYKLLWVRANKELRDKGGLEIKDSLLRNSYYVYVAYSLEDSDWVTNVMKPELESENLKLFVFEQDLTPNVESVRNMVSGISQSLSTVVVLSREFLKSNGCQLEFNMAKMHAKEKQAALIVVVLEPETLMDLATTHRGLYEYISANNCLNVHTADFWPKLKTKVMMSVGSSLTSAAMRNCHRANETDDDDGWAKITGNL